ncbi:MAG: bifunctional adenosylcobinamide kinase/adenosylcobinamide-phosphate guanylyltransferase [Campylobacterota bacterium]|nr:bifunctional adenosylcobinamide kinase/adenosylcobinamide-phosphate guanylyltransferase [Campylobacterota bacterium]
MKIFVYGGQKSGKTSCAVRYALKFSGKKKPIYLATYDNSYGDKNMQKRINRHIKERKKSFKSIEKTTKLHKCIKTNETYLIDCMSMWLLNHIELPQKKILKQLNKLLDTKANTVFVLNDISCGVIPADKISRKFVDMSGLIGQVLAQKCDEVVRVEYGIETKIK